LPADRRWPTPEHDVTDAAQHLGGGLSLNASRQKKVKQLVARLTKYRAAYYAGDKSVSDAAYDALEDELRALDPAHPFLAKVGSPAVADAWDKAQHEIAMGSLNKVTTTEELRQWLARCDGLLEKEDAPSIAADLYVAEKLDGISIELVYQDGGFVDGVTRGDGEVGERITSNVRRMRGVPPRIPQQGRISVRGEIILRLGDMREHFSDYTSPRNAAAGTARKLDGSRNEHLTVLCYDLAEQRDLHTEVDKFALLRKLGFATPNTYQGDIDAVDAIYRFYADGKRAELDYEIDGLVVRANQLAAQTALGELNRRPRGAVALKFASPTKVSTVSEILWETGNSGRVTPLCIFEPIMLVGAMVRRASLHNIANVERLGIGIGDEVLVSRRNDVIPYVEEVITKVGDRVAVPGTCGVCDEQLERDGEYLLCRNQSCPALLEGRIHNWIDAVGALEWGDKLIATLVDNGMVEEPGDLYKLSVADIASLDRHGDKSAQNALDQLHGQLPLAVDTFLAALGIEGFAAQTARLLVRNGYTDVDAVMAASVEELAAVKGLGDIKAANIVRGLSARAEEIERLRDAGIWPVSGEDAGPLAGKTVCITGSHTRARKELEQIIKGAGGRVSSGVTKDLDYLVIGDIESTSNKAKKARKYGTTLVDETNLMELIGGDE
jgi:DNA ligase (NAD+)